jgi:5-(carboxyamino)imidazole ribonucleotide mutase
MNPPLAIILMGSASDLPHVDKITAALDDFGIEHAQHIGSAHKTPRRLLDLLESYDNLERPKVFITVAGRSNALSGMADAAVQAPVIACPPSSSSFGGADIFSSLRMPSGVAPMVILEPVNAALAAAKIFALGDPVLAEVVQEHQAGHRRRLEEADAELQSATGDQN